MGSLKKRGRRYSTIYIYMQCQSFFVSERSDALKLFIKDKL